LSIEGLALVSQGVVEEGMGRLDEAATAALSGDMTNPLIIGITCCHLVTACELVRDFGRAAEWCERVREFAARVNFDVLLSVCRTQHAGVLMWCGAWSEAEAELDRAIRHLAKARPSMQEQPLVRLAELRRRQGRFDEALALLEKVEWHPHGRLVRAAIALDRGDSVTATDLARRFLEQSPPSNAIDRAWAGEILLQAELARGQKPGPRTLEDLHALATGIGTDPFRASTRAAEGRIAAASGRHDEARVALEEAISLFARAGAGYETARARVELARSLIALGCDGAARDELERACRVLEALGAAWDAQGARALLETVGARRAATAERANPAGLSARELEVLCLMAKGLKNLEIGERLRVSPFTVKRHVANILTKLDLPSRAAAAAYAAREGWA
jgi:LuxR family transcriptional regulator, maltose regulon positive regulatory protein